MFLPMGPVGGSKGRGQFPAPGGVPGMGVPRNGSFIMENPTKKWMIWGYPYLGHLHFWISRLTIAKIYVLGLTSVSKCWNWTPVSHHLVYLVGPQFHYGCYFDEVTAGRNCGRPGVRWSSRCAIEIFQFRSWGCVPPLPDDFHHFKAILKPIWPDPILT